MGRLKPSRWWAPLLALALAVAFPTAQAQGGDDARARVLFENGRILFDEGRYEDAIVAWEEAYRLSERPLLLYNIASAQERVGRYREAHDTLNRYRVYARADERASLDRRIANLERRLAENPATPVPAPTPAPTDRAGAEGDGRQPSDRVVPWPAWALFGGGAALLTTGTVFAVRAGAARTEAEGQCVPAGDGFLCPTSAEDALRRDRVSSWVADTGFWLGGAAVIGGTLVVVLDAPGGMSWSVGPRHVQLGGRF